MPRLIHLRQPHHPHDPLHLLRLLLVLCWLSGLSAAAQAQAVRITSAITAPGAGSWFPIGVPVARVDLPDEWARTRPGFAGLLWYRVEFASQEFVYAGEVMALHIEQVCSNMEVYLNGQLVGSGGRMSTPITNNCNQPQLLTLPAALLRAQGNVLDIKVAGHALAGSGSRLRAGGLSALTVGPLSVLALRHTRQQSLQVSVPQGMSAMLLLTGGFMFVLGFMNRRESHLAYFGALCVGWALINLRLWQRDSPLGHLETEFVTVAMLGFITWAAVQFLLRLAGLRRHWIDRALPLQCALLALTLLLAGPTRLHALANAWYAVLALEVVAAAVWHLSRLRRSRSAWLMGGMLSVVALAGVIEFAVQWLDAPAMAAHLAQLVVAVIFVLVGLRLVQLHGHALHQAEQGKLQLEQRVREATAEIERNFRQLSELRVEQVTERERKRIAADLHDDLGAKLLTIVHTSESERISTLAREALEEMRLSVRGLTGRPVRLADALGDWRAEIISRLAQAGIEGGWDAPEDLPHTLSARAYVQTTRILREATSNVIKHSGAASCTVTAGIADGDFQLTVQDNGDGISNEIDGRLDRGHGLASMKSRAKQLQGQCLVESGPGYGTVIRLTVPLDRATTGS